MNTTHNITQNILNINTISFTVVKIRIVYNNTNSPSFGSYYNFYSSNQKAYKIQHKNTVKIMHKNIQALRNVCFVFNEQFASMTYHL